MNTITVTNVEKFDNLKALIAHNFPRLHDLFCNRLQHDLRDHWFLFCEYSGEPQGERAAMALLSELRAMMADRLHEDDVKDMEHALSMYITHREIAQLDDLEPWEAEEQWAAWEREDASSMEDDRINMWRNEY